MTNPDLPDRRDPPAFPVLPIVTVDPPRLTPQEKYGGLYYLGIAGLAVVVALVGWFGWSAWSLRNVWWGVYVLHDTSRPEVERIEAAYALSRDARVNAQQRWDIALRRPLPPLARYLLAESFTTDLVAADPATFARVVARSEGWPDWLRLLGVRLMAVSAGEGSAYPSETLDELTRLPDPALAPWVDTIRAVSGEGDRAAIARIREAARGGPLAPIAGELVGAIEAGAFDRAEHLKAATRRLRSDHPEAARLWEGWSERNGRLVRDRP